MHLFGLPELLVCQYCSLKQFERTNGKCSRCGRSFGFTFLEVSLSGSSTVQSETARVTGRVLRALRLRRGLTQAAVGELSGIHRTYLSRAECGRVTPSPWALLRIAAALGVEKILLRVRSQSQ